MTPPPFDLQLEWHVLSALQALYVRFDSAPLSLFSGDRKLAWARLRAGTAASWEIAACDLLPSVADSVVAEQIARLRELSDRRRLLSVLDVVDCGLRGDTMTANEARELLAEASGG